MLIKTIARIGPSTEMSVVRSASQHVQTASWVRQPAPATVPEPPRTPAPIAAQPVAEDTKALLHVIRLETVLSPTWIAGSDAANRASSSASSRTRRTSGKIEAGLKAVGDRARGSVEEHAEGMTGRIKQNAQIISGLEVSQSRPGRTRVCRRLLQVIDLDVQVQHLR
jgi:hypothetical protein